MDSSGLGGAISAAQSGAELYCLVGIDHWAACLTKSEWASWAQALGSVAAILATLAIWRFDAYLRHQRTLHRFRALVAMLETGYEKLLEASKRQQMIDKRLAYLTIKHVADSFPAELVPELSIPSQGAAIALHHSALCYSEIFRPVVSGEAAIAGGRETEIIERALRELKPFSAELANPGKSDVAKAWKARRRR